MKILFLIIVLILMLVCWLLYAETKVEIKYKDKKLCLVIKNGFLKIKIYPKTGKKTDSKRNNESKSEAESKITALKKKYKDNKKIIKIFLRTMRYRMKVEKLYLRLDFGTGNAAATGMLYGVVWGMITGAYKVLHLFFNIDFPKTEIVPDFQNSKFDFTFEGIVKVRLVHIINTLIKIYSNNKKNSERGNKNGRSTSNSGLDVHSDAKP